MKYELTKNKITIDDCELFQIRAAKNFNDVKKGDLGGWISKDSTLSHEDDSWVYPKSKVYENSRIVGDSKIYSSIVIDSNVCFSNMSNSQIKCSNVFRSDFVNADLHASPIYQSTIVNSDITVSDLLSCNVNSTRIVLSSLVNCSAFSLLNFEGQYSMMTELDLHEISRSFTNFISESKLIGCELNLCEITHSNLVNKIIYEAIINHKTLIENEWQGSIFRECCDSCLDRLIIKVSDQIKNEGYEISGDSTKKLKVSKGQNSAAWENKLNMNKLILLNEACIYSCGSIFTDYHRFTAQHQ